MQDAFHNMWQLVYMQQTRQDLASLHILGVLSLTRSAVSANFGLLFYFWQKWYISRGATVKADAIGEQRPTVFSLGLYRRALCPLGF